MSLATSSKMVNDLIAKHVGRIIFHISASNWKVVFGRLSDKINSIATHPDITSESIIDLHFMSHCVMDRTRLVALLNRASFLFSPPALLLNSWTELSSLLVNMRIESQRTIAIHLRAAIWNWIDVFPSEFNEAIRTKGKTEGAPERVFDLIHSLAHAGSENVFWPTLTILNCISSDRISAEFQYRGKFTNRKVTISKFLRFLTMQIEAFLRQELRFTENTLRYLRNHSKFSEVSLACAIDICRAAAYIDPEGDVPLRLVASDIADEIKVSYDSFHVMKIIS